MAIKVVHEWFRHTKSAKENGKSIDAPDPAYAGRVTDLARAARAGYFSDIQLLELWDTGRNRTKKLIELYGREFQGAIPIVGPRTNSALQDIKGKNDPFCNIFYGEGVDAVDYARAIQIIAQAVGRYGFTQEAFTSLEKEKIFSSFPGLVKTADDLIAHWHDRAVAPENAGYPSVGIAACLHGPTCETGAMKLGNKDVVQYFAQHGGTQEGGLSGRLAFEVEGSKILEARLHLEDARFTIDPKAFK